MNEETRELVLAAQRQRTQAGRVVYERGLEIAEVSGEVYLQPTDGSALVFGDPTRLISEQPSIYIPVHRMIEVHFEGGDA